MFGDYVFEKTAAQYTKKMMLVVQIIWKKKCIIARCFRHMASGLLRILMI